MDYPERFFQSLFSNSRGLELARRFAIYFGILVIINSFLLVLIYYANKSQGTSPYFLYITENGEWSVYSESSQKTKNSVPYYSLVQQSVATKFITDYFRIYNDSKTNSNELWCECSNGCENLFNKCKICCNSGIGIYDDFSKNIIPVWQNIFANSETMEIENLKIDTVAYPSTTGGVFEWTGDLVSNKNATKKLHGFITIGRDSAHIKTVGFYVAGFNFYND